MTDLVPSQSFLPSLEGASEGLITKIKEVQENLESVDNFKLPRVRMTSDGAEVIEGEEPVKEIEAVILHAKSTNVYYKNPYNPNNVEPPTCFSLDGKFPDKSIKEPQNKTCKGCGKAEFGTNSMGSGKACRNLKPLYLLSNDAIIPRQLTISPTSLKAANTYFMNLAERGLAYRKIRTKINFFKENPKDTYVKVKFSMGEKLNESEIADIDFLKKTWLPVMDAQQIEQNEVEHGKKEIKDNNDEY